MTLEAIMWWAGYTTGTISALAAVLIGQAIRRHERDDRAGIVDFDRRRQALRRANDNRP